MPGAKKLARDLEEWNGQRRILPGPALVEAESSVLDRIRTALVAAGCMVMRNNVGVARMGKRHIRFGLGNGSSDLVVVVPPHGRFLGVEVKRPKGGRISPDQVKWAHAIRAYGGVVGTAKSVEEAMVLLAEAKGSR